MRKGINRRDALNLGIGAAGASLWPAISEAAAVSPALTATALRVEWLTDPLGIDTLTPRFRWEFATKAPARNVRATAVRVIVASSEAKLKARVGDIWDSGVIASGKLTLKPGKPLALSSHTPYFWAIAVGGSTGGLTWSAEARFVTGILKPAEWRAKWIAAKPDSQSAPHARGQSKLISDPAQTALPLMRKAFELKAKPVRAVVSVSGLGHFELTINGAPVSDSVLNPGWTEYTRTILYTTHEVTSLLKPGANVLGVRLGNGMYNVEKLTGRKSKFVDSFGAPKAILQMSLHHADGSVEHIVTGPDWQVSEGPILYSSIFAGEDVDARREPAGWDREVTAPGNWRPALEAKPQTARLRAEAIPPVRMHERFEAVSITEPKPGLFIYDLGENFAGRPEMVVRGPAGAKVTLTPSEVLGTDGLAWQKSFNAGAPDRWVLYNYTLSGAGDEYFTPRFNYHGFRFLQVEGAVPAGHANPQNLPQIVSLAGQFLYSDLPEAGRFACSDPLFYRTHKLIERAVLSNAYSVLTDCPHREKLGWLEQTHLNADTIFYNRDAVTLYEKMTADIIDTQQSDGMVPGIAPEYVAFVEDDGRDKDARNSPEWGAAVILSPWAAYRTYGDAQILAEGYPAMQRYIAYLKSRATGHIVDFGLGDWYDVGPDKLGASQLTSRALTGTATFYQAAIALSQIAQVLGRPAAESKAARDLAADIREAFNARFLDTTKGVYDRGSQTANAMPLAVGMVPVAQRQKVLEALVRAVRASGNGVTAGDVGFYYVVRALTENGRDDVLFDMMSVTDRPSYGYQLAKGTTALAESWNADPTKSLNHFMLGHGEGWLYGSLAGIRVDFARPAENILTIAPRPVGTVEAASATCRTVFGEVSSAWRRKAAQLTLDVSIPAGAKACVIIPSTQPAAVREGGARITGASAIKIIRPHPQSLEVIVGSGSYRFTTPFAPPGLA